MIRKPFNDKWNFRTKGGDFHIVDIPHDAMILEQRDPNSPGGSAGAFFPSGEYVYEKTFFAPKNWEKQHIQFQFEGVYKNSKVFINDTKAGGRPYGYTPYFVNANSLLRYGAENTIRVEVDNHDLPNSRWYSGAGIYRPVWLWIGAKEYIEAEGVKISTLSYNPARIKIDVAHSGGDVEVEISKDGRVVASGLGDSFELEIPDARLWRAESPELYTYRVTLSESGTVVDEADGCFGIRLVEWNNTGLYINGKNTLLRGGCIHHDNGILGARSYPESEERRIRIMKNAGFNAIRSSHNPAGKSMLEACDRLGMLVIDETWDMWYGHKNKYDYAGDFLDNYVQDIEALVDRDFNHPSVIMYSIGNEISDPYEAKGVDLAKDIADRFRRLDSSRAVTAGVNFFVIHKASKGEGLFSEDKPASSDSNEKKSAEENASGSLYFNMMVEKIGTGLNNAGNSEEADAATRPFIDALDIAGYNYASGRYPLEKEAYPNCVIVGSETFPQDIAKNWKMVKEYPYLVGDFMWTGWDYLGETGVGGWSYTYAQEGGGFGKPYPWILADTGTIDILGNPGGEMFLAAAVWGVLEKPAICVRPVNHPETPPLKSVWRGTNAIPSWSWKNCAGNEAIIEVYFDAYEAELLLNGKSLGRQEVNDCLASFTVPYEEGNLTAIVYDAMGREITRTELNSAIGRYSIRLTPEVLSAKAGGIAYVAIDIVGENGVVESNADTQLSVSVEGGELLAFGSANPRTEENYNSGKHTAYYGRAQAVIRRNESGTAKVSASGAGLGVSEVLINFS